jgi:MFS family permease
MSAFQSEAALSTGRPSVVVAVCLAALILPLSFSGAAIATPGIGRELGGSPVALTWITNAFMLSFGSLLMAAGTLADQWGRKRVFVGGVGLFVLFSLALGVASSVWMVDLLRAGQGVGGAAALAGGSAAMAQEFDGRARTRAFSMLGTTFGIGLAFGPIIAGWLIEHLGWRSIFMTGAVIGTLALGFGLSRLHESRDPDAKGLDWPGLLSFTGMLTLFTFGVIQAPESGWTAPLVVMLLTGAVLLLAIFVLVERRAARPMLDLTLFRFPRFVGVQLLPIATCYAYVVLLILLPLRFIGIEGHSVLQAGVMMSALSLPMIVVPTLAVTLTRWLSAGIISGIGLLIAAAGVLWLGHLGPSDGMAVILPMLLIGLGAGFPWGLMDALSVTVVPKERAGMATGIFNTAKVASEGVTLAIVSAALAGLSSLGVAHRAPAADRLSGAELREVGQRLATGDLMHAAALVPGLDRSVLVQGYIGGFEILTYVLAAVAILAALASFWLLGGRTVAAGETKALPERMVAEMPLD